MTPNYEVTELANLIRQTTRYCGSVRVIAIDGPAGSGKTTLAQQLADELSARDLNSVHVVHMDDVYRGWSQDLVTDLANKLETQILKPIKKGLPASYTKFDWHKNAYDDQVAIPECDFLILEGVGAANPKLRPYFAYSIWIEADPSVRLDRVLARDGQEIKAQMITWQLKEQSYFRGLEVKPQADLALTGD